MVKPISKFLNCSIYFITLFVLFSCSENDKPSDQKMKECLINEFGSKVVILGFEQQDGLTREKEGVKYYEGYFNAEIKFISNHSNKFKVGETYKIVKGVILFMKTENGWNCQSFNMSQATFIKIKEMGDNATHIKAKESKKISSESSAEPLKPQMDIYKEYIEFPGKEYNGTVDGLQIKMKILWKDNKRIDALYYHTNNNKKLYSWEGTNFKNGELQIIEFTSGGKVGKGQLTKILKPQSIVWTGEIERIDGSFVSVSIYRPR